MCVFLLISSTRNNNRGNHIRTVIILVLVSSDVIKYTSYSVLYHTLTHSFPGERKYKEREVLMCFGVDIWQCIIKSVHRHFVISGIKGVPLHK